MCTGEGYTDEIRRGKTPGEIFSYFEAYYELTPTYEQKGISQLHHDFNKQKSNCQTSSHEYSFSTTFSENSNGLASTTVWNFGRNKQEKCYSKHQFPINIPQKSKLYSG